MQYYIYPLLVPGHMLLPRPYECPAIVIPSEWSCLEEPLGPGKTRGQWATSHRCQDRSQGPIVNHTYMYIIALPIGNTNRKYQYGIPIYIYIYTY